MTYDTRMKDLERRQEDQIKKFERHRAEIFKAVQETEREILQQYNCSYRESPLYVQAIINTLREDYYRYWWNDGLILSRILQNQKKAKERILNPISEQ